MYLFTRIMRLTFISKFRDQASTSAVSPKIGNKVDRSQSLKDQKAVVSQLCFYVLSRFYKISHSQRSLGRC